ncbi:MliC family protein [Stutzerimonas urumqiensis]|uniref:MliC family protein n=1 Tax=Stutzerimonas urumqiensis TaxID=638269 RepID=UPI000EAC0A4E|nr:MliC family protein [Stutzerimonas urumqiensis]
MRRTGRGAWLGAGLLAIALTGCSHWQTGEDAPFTRWECAGGNSIAWRYVDEARRTIDVRVGDDQRAYRLRQEPSAFGTFYSDGVLAFHDRGSQALVYRVTDDKVLAHGCSAALINLPLG